jgi:membrane dipeptidase
MQAKQGNRETHIMWKRVFLGIAAVALAGGAASLAFAPSVVESQMNKIAPHAPYQVSDKARTLHKGLNLADLHSDTLLWNRDVLSRGDRGHVDIPRLQEGRFALQVFSAVTKAPRNLNYDRNPSDSDQITLLVQVQMWPARTWNSLLQRALYQSERLHDAAKRQPKNLMVIRTRKDLETLMTARARGENLVGGLLATEGAHPLEGQLENLATLRDAGYRMIGLQHFFDNELGGSLHGMNKGGLTPFGREVVKEIERTNMVVDLAHSSPAVVDDVLAMSTQPVVVSHTGVRGACESPRNLSDAQMRAIAAKGGLIGIGYWDGAVCDISPKGVAKSIRYAADLVGVDHVALGSDYDGSTTVMFDASESVALIDALIAAGFTDDEIAKIGGGNQIRLLMELLPPA